MTLMRSPILETGLEPVRAVCGSRTNAYQPGMMYVKDRNPDSICDTALAFLVINSPYMLNHFGGTDKEPGIRLDALTFNSILRLGHCLCRGK